MESRSVNKGFVDKMTFYDNLGTSTWRYNRIMVTL